MSECPLVIVEDEGMRAELARVAAACGRRVRTAADPLVLESYWEAAPFVLMDEPAARQVVERGFPHRREVYLVYARESGTVWQPAFALGARDVWELPTAESRIAELCTDAEPETSESGSNARTGGLVSVLGGCGGAGASVLATTIAVLAARRGEQVLLVDCDPLGGGLDLVAGWENAEGLRWSGVAVRTGHLATGALHAALPTRRVGNGRLTVLACDRADPSAGFTAEAMRAVLAAGRRAGNVVVCDLARELSDPVAVAARHADLTVVLTRAEVRACVATTKTLYRLRELANAPTRLVVRGPAPSGMRDREVQQVLGVRPLVSMREQPEIPSVVDCSGVFSSGMVRRGPIARASRAVLHELAELRPAAVDGATSA